jgi:hypothetical protein
VLATLAQPKYLDQLALAHVGCGCRCNLCNILSLSLCAFIGHKGCTCCSQESCAWLLSYLQKWSTRIQDNPSPLLASILSNITSAAATPLLYLATLTALAEDLVWLQSLRASKALGGGMCALW